jgi:hypothetical protein
VNLGDRSIARRGVAAFVHRLRIDHRGGALDVSARSPAGLAA